MRALSIKTRLSLGFYLFLFLVVFLGIFNIAALTDFNSVADQIRNRWLPNTRFLGDLNNYTSDFRAAEGTLLLASRPQDIAASQQEMHALDGNIAKAQHGYEQVYHDAKETELYGRFSADWKTYRDLTDRLLTLMRSGRQEAGIALYKTRSKSAYDAASDTLGQLTDMDVLQNQEASDQAAHAYRQMRMLTAFAMLTAACMMVIAIIYIRRSISTPMLDLAKDMHRLAGNDMEVPIHGADRPDEIGEMARALSVFRNNAVDLLLSRQGLAQQASMLKEKLAHEQHLMEAQRNFISMASHEFRTPLNIIHGHAQRLAKAKDQPPETIAERARKISNAVRQLTDLIDNLINAARLFKDNPKLYFHPMEIDVAALLHEACSQHRDILSAAQIVEKFDRPLPMTGDPKLLAQAFGNLLSNAIKYSPSGGLIEIIATSGDGHITVTIRDRGIGIPEQDMQGIFERYSRGSNVTDISGTGIGLHLVKVIVEMHSGRITAESREGHGSAFTLHLPVRLPAA